MKHTPNFDFKPIFLDFETNKSGLFYLVGVKSGDVFQQWVLTQDLIGLAKAKHLEVQKAEDFALNILERMCEDNAVLVAYSSAELSIFNNLFDKNPLKKKFWNCVTLIYFLRQSVGFENTGKMTLKHCLPSG